MKKQNSSKLFSKNKLTKAKKNVNIFTKNSVHIVHQKESSKKDSSKIEDILNHPVLKRRLPPLDKNSPEKNDDENFENFLKNSKNLQEEINYNIEKLKKSEIKKEKEKETEEIKDSLEFNKEIYNYNFKIVESLINRNEEKYNKINNEKLSFKDNIIKNDMGEGTPSYPDNIQDLKDEANSKTKLILKLSDEQNEYKEQLNSLLEKLNTLMIENADFLKKEAELEEFGLEDNLYELKYQLEQKKKDFNTTKNQNKILKHQYDFLNNKEKNLSSDYIEKRLDKIKSENNDLLKQITKLKTKSILEEKKLKNYNSNGKYLTDINKIANELKTLETKKHEYYKKYINNYKLIDTCIKEFENLEKFYLNQKQTKNYFNAKIEEEINRLKEDLTPNKEEIIKKVENDTSFIIRKIIHNEKIRENIFKTPIPYKVNDINKLKIKKRSSLDISKVKLNRTNYSGKDRKINIIAKDSKVNKSQLNGNINKEKKDIEINININYDELKDFEYKEMLNKKEYFYDIITKLEKSIKESQKMYQRKIRDMNIVIEKNERQLAGKKNENELLKIEIDNLSKLLSITEEENKLMNVQNNGKNKKQKNNTNTNNNNNNKNTIPTEQTEKELESQKEYLSPELYQNTKSNKEKIIFQTNSNTDVTRNEILNDLKALNSQNLEDPIQDSEILRKNNLNKVNNLTMKFPDLSNIEENVNVNLNNEADRNKIIEDIKKKYNIKNNGINEDFSLGNDNQEEKEKEKNKLYFEHENSLDEKIEERFDNDNNNENKLKYQYQDNNDNNVNNDEERINEQEEYEDSLGQNDNDINGN